MTYEEVMEQDVMVSRKEAQIEIVRRHGMAWDEFVDDMGDHDEYKGSDVLIWLGY